MAYWGSFRCHNQGNPQMCRHRPLDPRIRISTRAVAVGLLKIIVTIYIIYYEKMAVLFKECASPTFILLLETLTLN